ncbi:hypothetical protein D0T56_14775 [Dysgonomonas sp. 520]|nr:hypothetical protein [Dysgonomonas sp. 520]
MFDNKVQSKKSDKLILTLKKQIDKIRKALFVAVVFVLLRVFAQNFGQSIVSFKIKKPISM